MREGALILWNRWLNLPFPGLLGRELALPLAFALQVNLRRLEVLAELGEVIHIE